MERTLENFIAEIFSYYGGIVEKTGRSDLNVIVPEGISKSLHIPEYTSLKFSPDESPEEAIYISYDSEFFNSIKILLPEEKRITYAQFKPYVPNTEKLSKSLPVKIILKNAAFRLEKIELETFSYLLIYFRYIAISDERYEGILPLLINQKNLSTMVWEDTLNIDLEGLKELDSEPEGHNPELLGIFPLAYSAAGFIVHQRLKDFITGLERRLNRDIKRVYEYYHSLKTETKTLIEKKSTSLEEMNQINDPLIDKQIDTRKIKEAERERLLQKMDIIKAEQRLKIQDLIEKYALNIQIEPIAILNIETDAPIFWINIKRRLMQRKFPVTYNPFIRGIDPLPCEACLYPQNGYHICDQAVHIICDNCFSKVCPHCQKPYCRVCHKQICPKCKK
ncbi:MAG: hypothetical protein AB1797_01450 [bacterium]